MFLPVARSSTKKKPLRLACATSLRAGRRLRRRTPPASASRPNRACRAATPGSPTPSCRCPDSAPPPKPYRGCRPGGPCPRSRAADCPSERRSDSARDRKCGVSQVMPPPCFAASRLGQVSRPGSPFSAAPHTSAIAASPVSGSCDSRYPGRSRSSPLTPVMMWFFTTSGAIEPK